MLVIGLFVSIGCSERVDASGRSDGLVPRLAGQLENVLIHKLQKLRDGMITLPVMVPFASALTSVEITQIAHYIATLPSPKGGVASNKNYAAYCAGCHGQMADELPLGNPWLASNANYLDHITLAVWLQKEGASKWTIEAFRIITRAVMSGYPERISLLWFLHYLQSSGGLLGMALNDNGLQDLRFVGGSQMVSINTAKELGNRVLVNEPRQR